jgi:hypothetical protein
VSPGPRFQRGRQPDAAPGPQLKTLTLGSPSKVPDTADAFREAIEKNLEKIERRFEDLERDSRKTRQDIQHMEGMIDPNLTKEYMDQSLLEVRQAFDVVDHARTKDREEADRTLKQLRFELDGFTENVEKAIGDTRSGVNLLATLESSFDGRLAARTEQLEKLILEMKGNMKKTVEALTAESLKTAVAPPPGDLGSNDQMALLMKLDMSVDQLRIDSEGMDGRMAAAEITLNELEGA